MDADRLLVALVAATALVAFGVSAANVVGVTDAGVDPDVQEANDREVGEPPGPPESPGECLLGCGGVRSIIAGIASGLSTQAVLLVAGAAVAVLGAFWYVTRGRPDAADDDVEPIPTVDAPETRPQGITTSTPPDVPPSNEVYRAWRELASTLDPGEQQSLTPAEYAERARERGYDEDAVEALTAVFRRVRYGREDATADRETRARQAIEDILGEDEP